MDIEDQITQCVSSGRLVDAWNAIRTTRDSDADALARLSFEFAAVGQYCEFAFDLAVDVFRSEPSVPNALNLANVIGLLGDESSASEINGLVRGLSEFDAVRGATQKAGFANAGVKDLLDAMDRTSVDPDAVLSVARKARERVLNANRLST